MRSRCFRLKRLYMVNAAAMIAAQASTPSPTEAPSDIALPVPITDGVAHHPFSHPKLVSVSNSSIIWPLAIAA